MDDGRTVPECTDQYKDSNEIHVSQKLPESEGSPDKTNLLHIQTCATDCAQIRHAKFPSTVSDSPPPPKQSQSCCIKNIQNIFYTAILS